MQRRALGRLFSSTFAKKNMWNIYKERDRGKNYQTERGQISSERGPPGEASGSIHEHQRKAERLHRLSVADGSQVHGGVYKKPQLSPL